MKPIQSTLILIILTFGLILHSGCGEAQKKQQPETSKAVELKPETEPQKEQKKTATTPPRPKPQKGTPVLKVENPVHDFGEVGPGTRHKYKFNFKNVGDTTLKVNTSRGGCSCTVSKLTKKEYAPGESGTIEVTFKVPTRQGPTKQHLYILSNDKNNPRFKLTVKATVVLKVVASPTRLNLSLIVENAGIKPITVKSKDDKLFSIKSFISTNRAITAEFDPKTKAAEFVLEPVVDLEKLKKKPSGSITIKLTHPQGNVVNVSFKAPPLFKVSNPRLYLQNAEPGKPVIRDVSIMANYGKTVQVESITSSKQIIEIISREQVGNNVKLKLKITPPEKKGKSRFFKDDLRIKLNGGQELTILCTGIYKTNPVKPNPVRPNPVRPKPVKPNPVKTR